MSIGLVVNISAVALASLGAIFCRRGVRVLLLNQSGLSSRSRLSPGPVHSRPAAKQIAFNDRPHETGEKGLVKEKGENEVRR